MRLIAVLLVIVALGAFAFGFLTYKKWEGQQPLVAFDHEFTALGRSPVVALNIADTGTGLRHVTVRIKQKERELVLIDDSFTTEKDRKYDLGKVLVEKGQIEEGPATLTISAIDNALRNFFGGNTAMVTKEFSFHLKPPALAVLDGQHYINQGGSECVVYRVTPADVVSGVQVGDHFFPGFPAGLADKDVHFALFAFKYDWPDNTPMKVVARDAAGNETSATFWNKVSACSW